MTEVIAVQLQLLILPSIFVGLALLGALFVFGFYRWFHSSYNFDGWLFGGVILWVCSAIVAVVWVVLLVPFDSKYHVVYKLEGTVEFVTNNWNSGNGKQTTVPIITLSSYDNPIYVPDLRIIGQQGKDVELSCTIAWVPNAMDATRCTISKIKEGK